MIKDFKLSLIPKFDKDTNCVKCGSNNLYHRLRQKGEKIDSDWNKFDEAQFELIRSVCRNCGHRWISLPLDAVIINNVKIVSFSMGQI